MKKILFICTGNYYRSRYAELLFNHLASGESIPAQAESRGLEAAMKRNPGPISPHALYRCEGAGIPTFEPLPYPRQMQDHEFELYSLIFAMDEQEHKPMMQKYFPDYAEKIFYWQVRDIQFEDPANALEILEQEVRRLAANVKAGKL